MRSTSSAGRPSGRSSCFESGRGDGSDGVAAAPGRHLPSAQEFKLSESALFKYLRQGKLKRWRRTGNRRTFVEREELKQLLKPRVVKG
jgi:hypothetical protein